MKITEMELRPVFHAVTRMIDEETANQPLGDVHLRSFLAQEIRGMVLQMTSCIYGQKIVDYDITYPDGWWEAVKERWAPAWAKKRWPVKYVRHQIKLTELYPKVAPPPKDARFEIRVPVLEKYEYRDMDERD